MLSCGNYQSDLLFIPEATSLASGMLEYFREPQLLQDTQSLQLRMLITHAYHNCAYYRSLFDDNQLIPNEIKHLSDLLKIPTLTKDIIRSNFNDLLIAEFAKLDVQHYDAWPGKAKSAGTTSKPIEVFLERSNAVQFFAQILYLEKVYNLNFLPREVSILKISEFPSPHPPYLPHYSFAIPALHNTYYHFIHITSPAWESPGKLLKHLERLNPRIIWGSPFELLLLARLLRTEVRSYSFQPSLLLSHREALIPAIRKTLEEFFQAEVVDCWGLSELGGVIGIECKLHNGYHIFNNFYILEILEDDDNPVDIGKTGEIVVTKLNNFIQPLIRYRTGDLGALSVNSCSCGSPYPLLARLEGRRACNFVRSDGVLSNPWYLVKILDEMPVLAYQVIQEDLDTISVNYISNKISLPCELMQLVTESIRKFMKSNCEVNFKEVSDLETRGIKRQIFICQLPDSCIEKAQFPNEKGLIV